MSPVGIEIFRRQRSCLGPRVGSENFDLHHEKSHHQRKPSFDIDNWYIPATVLISVYCPVVDYIAVFELAQSLRLSPDFGRIDLWSWVRLIPA